MTPADAERFGVKTKIYRGRGKQRRARSGVRRRPDTGKINLCARDAHRYRRGERSRVIRGQTGTLTKPPLRRPSGGLIQPETAHSHTKDFHEVLELHAVETKEASPRAGLHLQPC